MADTEGMANRESVRHVSIRVLLLAALLLLACAGSRFATPYYGSGGPPFISPKGHSLWRAASALGPRTPSYRVILIGDAGATRPEEATLSDLGLWAEDLVERTAVVFLGDNLYPSGLGDGDERGEGILLQQLHATRARKLFVPGNHDWGNVFPSAETLARQERFIEAFRGSPAKFLPKGGCPGPAVETLVEPGAGLSRGLHVISLDLDWWLLDAGDRPSCPGIASERDFLRLVAKELRVRADDHVIVAAHHPIRTGGPHGGYGRGFWTNRLVSVANGLGITVQDLDADVYRRMVRRLVPALSKEPPLVYAAGHDHGLQVIEGRDTAGTLVVSGAGSGKNITTVTAIAGTLFAHAHPGFVVLDFYGDTADFGDASASDRVVLRVVEAGRARPVFEMELPQR
jgi:hypothetical protein